MKQYDTHPITGNTTSTATTAYANIGGLYSTPVLLDTIVKEDSIELVYKRQYQVSNNWGYAKSRGIQRDL